MDEKFTEAIGRIVENDSRYHMSSYEFVSAAVTYTINKMNRARNPRGLPPYFRTGNWWRGAGSIAFTNSARLRRMFWRDGEFRRKRHRQYRLQHDSGGMLSPVRKTPGLISHCSRSAGNAAEKTDDDAKKTSLTSNLRSLLTPRMTIEKTKLPTHLRPHPFGTVRQRPAGIRHP